MSNSAFRYSNGNSCRCVRALRARRINRVKFGAGLLAVALAAVSLDSQALDITDMLKSLGTKPADVQNAITNMLPGGQKSGSSASTGNGGATDIAGTIGNTLGLAACASQSRKKLATSGMARLVCTMAPGLVAEMSRQLGSKISDHMRVEDQRQVLVAAAESLKTGEPSVVDLPDSSVSIDPVGPGSTREMNVELVVNASAISELPHLRVLGKTQEVRGAYSLRSTPQGTGPTVGSVRSGETVHVIGQVDGSDSMLVSRWITEDGVPRPMGTGFLPTSALKPSSKKDFPTDADVLQTAPQTRRITVLATLQCQKLDFQKKDASGNRVQDSSYLCIGPDGGTTSAS